MTETCEINWLYKTCLGLFIGDSVYSESLAVSQLWPRERESVLRHSLGLQCINNKPPQDKHLLSMERSLSQISSAFFQDEKGKFLNSKRRQKNRTFVLTAVARHYCTHSLGRNLTQREAAGAIILRSLFSSCEGYFQEKKKPLKKYKRSLLLFFISEWRTVAWLRFNDPKRKISETTCTCKT